MSSNLTVDQDTDAGQPREATQRVRPPMPLGDRIPPTLSQRDNSAGKRMRTGGEMLFDATTYGGFALVGNEVVSTAIVAQAEKPTAFGRLFEHTAAITKKIGPEGKLPYLQSGRFNYINYAILGGFTMVPLIKFLEDNKGRLVRMADAFFHGAKADNDPEIRRAHEEMDNAPKQSWGSLMNGRLLTVAAAWGVDASINWKDGWSARALKGTKLEKYSSLEAITGRVADSMGKSIATHRGMNEAQKLGLTNILNKGFGLLSLSATLTAIFYVTSKFFAQRRDERREVYEEIHQKQHSEPSISTPLTAQRDDAVQASELPANAIHTIAHDARVAPTPQLGKEA